MNTSTIGDNYRIVNELDENTGSSWFNMLHRDKEVQESPRVPEDYERELADDIARWEGEGGAIVDEIRRRGCR